MGSDKVEVLMETSNTNLHRAEEAFGRKEWDEVVLHASLAVESASNALIIRLGGHEALDHRAASALNAVARHRAPEWLKDEDFREMIKKGLEVQREVVHSRYPHLVEGEWIPPSRYYTAQKAEGALSASKLVLATVERYLRLEYR